MIELIEFKNSIYPKFQSVGYAAQFAIPYATHVCKGKGFDIGCNRIEWMFGKEMAQTSKDTNDIQHTNWTQFDKDASNNLKFIDNVAYSFPIDPVINGYTADKLPCGDNEIDYIFSSHCLEHLDNWVDILDHWTNKLRGGGVMFLYLPDYSQEYWRPWNNRKHKNILTPLYLKDYFESNQNYNKDKLFVSSIDLNNSFMVIAEKK